MRSLIEAGPYVLQALAAWELLLVPGAAYVIAQAYMQRMLRLELPLGLTLGAAVVALMQGMADVGIYFQDTLDALPPLGRLVGGMPTVGLGLLLAALTAGEVLLAVRLNRRSGERLTPGAIKESL
ncbi:MAG: hypothetical protein ACI4XW_08850, partial [Candidatus Spyradocola sp.]